VKSILNVGSVLTRPGLITVTKINIYELTQIKFEEFKNASIEKSKELKKYFNLLPDNSTLKEKIKEFSSEYLSLEQTQNWFKDKLSRGSIDVNIMTKLDRANFSRGEKLPSEFNDAHAALRGYANSDLASSIILSAGMNPRLFGYMEGFEDFYPNQNGEIKKKIVLKVSDYRSAMIQGKFLAKKGLWVSEYRIESGLNCGGHAFATEGFLMGPILAEFKEKREELKFTIYDVLKQAFEKKNRAIPKVELPIKITAQGGIGTNEEHQFLLDHYQIDSVGWGTPFLLVPEVTTVDKPTLQKLVKAKEKDLYLSDVSPLGVPFNNLRGNTKDDEQLANIAAGRPGSACPKEFIALNNDYIDKGLCLASRKYQSIKLKELTAENISSEEYEQRYAKITAKSCICVGLSTATLLNHDLSTKVEGKGVSICPGPNMAYFSKIIELKEMIDHIYGRTNIISRDDRPNMFVKELGLYLDYLKNKMEEAKYSMTRKQEKSLLNFSKNLNEGIAYYQEMFGSLKGKFEGKKSKILSDFEAGKKALQILCLEIDNMTKQEA